MIKWNLGGWGRRISKIGAISFLFAVALGTWSMYKYPYTASLEFYMAETPSPPTDISVDTGYGFNQYQVLSPTEKWNKSLSQGTTRFPLYHVFPRWALPSRIQVHSRKPPLAIIIYADQVRVLDWIHSAENTYVSILPPLTAHRVPRHWIFFVLGLLVASVPTFLFLFHLKSLYQERREGVNPKIFAAIDFCIGLVFIALFTLFYPGYLNGYNAMGAMDSFAQNEFFRFDSVYLSYLWAALFEVIPSFYFIAFVQAAWALVFLLRLRAKIGSQDTVWLQRILYVSVLVLFFNIPALKYFMFIDRNPVSAWLVFFAFVTMWAHARPSQTKIGWAEPTIYLILAFLVHFDNLVFGIALCAVAFAFNNRKVAIKQTALFVCAVIVSQLTISRITTDGIGHQEWDLHFFMINFSLPYADTIKQVGLSHLTEEETAVLGKLWNLEKIDAEWTPYNQEKECFEYYHSAPTIENGTLIGAARFAWKYKKLMLLSRLHTVHGILLRQARVFDIETGSPPQIIQRAMDYKFYPQDFTRGLRGYFSGSYGKTYFPPLYFFLALFILSFGFLFCAPIVGWCGLAFCGRLFVVFVFAPSSFPLYLYDLQLIGLFLPIMIITERKWRSGSDAGNPSGHGGDLVHR